MRATMVRETYKNGTAVYEWMGEYYEVTVYPADGCFERDAFDRLYDARKWAKSQLRIHKED